MTGRALLLLAAWVSPIHGFIGVKSPAHSQPRWRPKTLGSDRSFSFARATSGSGAAASAGDHENRAKLQATSSFVEDDGYSNVVLNPKMFLDNFA